VGMNAAAHGKRTAGKKSASPRTLRKKSARSQANVAKTTNVATPPAGPALDNDEKFQLARNLGLPSDALEATLKEASS